MRAPRTIGLLAVATALLTGCSAPQAADSPKGSSYSNLAALRTAYTSTGSSCPLWTEDDDIQAAAQSGHCGNGLTLSTYLSPGDVLGEVKLLRDTASSGDDGSSAPSTELLIGPNWLISGAHVRQLQPKLGGRLAVINPSAAN